MQEGNGAESGIQWRARAVLAQGGIQSAHEDAQDAAKQLWIALQEVTYALGDGQDPLAHGNSGDYVVDQVGGGLHHAAGVASRAEAAGLAGERHQEIVAAGRAAGAGDAEGWDAALEVLAECVLYVRGYRIIVRTRFAGVGQEGLQVFLDQAVERGFLRPPGFVDGGERSLHADRESKSRAGRGISGVLP